MALIPRTVAGKIEPIFQGINGAINKAVFPRSRANLERESSSFL